MTLPNFHGLLSALDQLREYVEPFDPRGYDSKRQMRRARGRHRQVRRAFWFYLSPNPPSR